MSLHQIAKHVQSKGRGRDSMLVHMSPREVAGLQALAMAHGGKLSINPNTGLPEAGFLENILPVVAAGALTYFTAGAAAPMLGEALAGTALAGAEGILAGAGAGALIGGGMSAIQGGNFGQGALMGGLGGGLAGAFGAFGGPSPFDIPATPTVPEVPVAPGAPIDTTAAATVSPVPQPSVTTAPLTGAPTEAFTGTAAGQQAATLQGQARIAALNQLAEQTGTGVTSASFGAAPTPGAEQALFRAENYANPSELGDIYQQPMKPPSVRDLAKMPSSEEDKKKKGFDIFGYNITPGEAAAGLGGLGMLASLSDRNKYGVPAQQAYTSPLARISPNFKGYVPPQPQPYYQAQYPVYNSGGVVALQMGGGPVERMSAMDQQSGMYPQGMIDKTYYATPSQRPASMEVVKSDYDTPVNPMTGIGPQFAKGGDTRKESGVSESSIGSMDPYSASLARLKNAMAMSQMPQKTVAQLNPAVALGDVNLAKGGISDLGGYSDGGRLLRGPGDGVSDDIPAQIGARQPARLADGEFVVPARIVSEIGNGSTEAGARKLYAMMDRVQNARRKSMKKGKFAVDSKADKLLPA